MEPITVVAATALVGAMATDGWQRARDGVVALWKRVHPERAGTVEAELEELREEVLALRAQQGGDSRAEEEGLAAEWEGRLARLLRRNAALEAELKRVVEEDLTPSLPQQERDRITSIDMRAYARDHGRNYQAAGDLHIDGGT
ncbi:hypothetical protein ACFYVL_02085 [Streptomyces sp. NPDC004111]|uniref:hypothetical protein n=1 Tax=Streptomyces sp. NPDC004111 TaxID=3364690 RepID=UPI0036AA662A